LNQGTFDLGDRDITFSKSQGAEIECNAESSHKPNSYQRSAYCKHVAFRVDISIKSLINVRDTNLRDKLRDASNPLCHSAHGYTREELRDLLKFKLGSQLLELTVELGDVVVRLDRAQILPIMTLLKSDTEFDFNMLVDVTAIDWLDKRRDRFEVVYHLLSITNRYRLRVRAWVPEATPEVDSITSLWNGANFMERETWDMYGVRFKGHPDLRRLLMYDEFQGHPLRKDYDVQHKQPRIPLRFPEVRNTAVDMNRPALVQIRSRKTDSGSRRPGENRQVQEVRRA
jgi:NADH-quinone oxidoreductase subunit C